MRCWELLVICLSPFIITAGESLQVTPGFGMGEALLVLKVCRQ